MLNILSITTPIYLLILLGYSTTRWGLFSKADMRIVGRFVLNLALPSLLFRALAQRSIGEILNVRYLLAYTLGSLAAIGIGYAFCRRVPRLSPVASTFYAMGMSCSNSGFVGYPILLLILPSVAGVSLALNMMVENLIAIPLLLFMAEHARSGVGGWQSLGHSLRRLIGNPMIIGLVIGIAVSLTGFSVPSPLMRTVELLANASSALSLFVIGGTLVDLPLHGMGLKIWPIVVGKLILHPLMVFVFISLLPLFGLGHLDPSLRVAAVLLASVPMLSIYATLAQPYGHDDFTAVALLVTTIASFFTLSGLLWVMQTF